MTRSLTDAEFDSIGNPKEWGVLSVKPMGATIRMTKDRRILIRNTAEVHNPSQMSKLDLDKRSINQIIGIKKGSHSYQMILYNPRGRELYLEQEIVLKYLKKLTKIFLL